MFTSKTFNLKAGMPFMIIKMNYKQTRKSRAPTILAIVNKHLSIKLKNKFQHHLFSNMTAWTEIIKTIIHHQIPA